MNPSDFHKVYILDEINYSSGVPKSRVLQFSQDMWDLNQVRMEGSTEYNHSADQNLYFMPGVTVPRVKVREFLQRNGGAIVKDPSRATTIFYSDTTLREIFHEVRFVHKLSKTHYLRFLETVYIKDQDLLADKALGEAMYNQEVEKVNSTEYPFVLLSYSGKGYVDGSTAAAWRGNKNVSLGIPSEHFVQGAGIAVREEAVSKTAYIESKLLCHQNALIKHLNSTDLNYQMYKELRLMLSSKDPQNITMGVEIMANSDYDKSIVYLLVLLKDFHQHISSTKAAEQVNFKTLVAYLGQDPRWLDVRTMGQILADKKLSNSANRDLMMKLMFPSLYTEKELSESEDSTDELPYEDFPEDDVDLGEEL